MPETAPTIQDSTANKQEAQKEDVEMENATENDDSFADLDEAQIHSCDNLLYKISIKNMREDQNSIKFKIRFNAKEKDINLQWPHMGVKGNCKHSETESIVILLPKINPYDNSDELSKLNLEFIVNEVKTEASFSVQNAEQSCSNNANKTVSFDDNVSTIATYGPEPPGVTAASTGTGVADTNDFNYGNQGGQEKNCGACTMLNPITASICEICMTEF